jgi:OOP family OmpA-OmpF porin
MQTARGISSLDAWLGGVGFGLKHLAALKRGDVQLRNLDMWIGGEAEDIASYRAVKTALANNVPKGIKLTGDLLTAPVVSPFAWSAQVTDGRLVLAGYVPSEAAHTELLAVAKARFGTMVIVDQMQPGDGAPKGWSGTAVASLNALARLQAGSAEMKDAVLVVSGLAGDASVAEVVRTALRAALPPSIRFTDQIKAKEPPRPPPLAPEPVAPSASAPAKEAEAKPPSRPETVGALPEHSKADQSTAQPAIPTASQAASAADLRAKACEDRLTALVTTGQVAFEYASAELGRASFATLDKLAEAAKACPDMRVEVAGHASIEGSAEGNQHLSIRRAQSVVAYLVKAGVDSTQLLPVGYGATRPVAPNDTGENMAKNRRIEFVVRPK